MFTLLKVFNFLKIKDSYVLIVRGNRLWNSSWWPVLLNQVGILFSSDLVCSYFFLSEFLNDNIPKGARQHNSPFYRWPLFEDWGQKATFATCQVYKKSWYYCPTHAGLWGWSIFEPVGTFVQLHGLGRYSIIKLQNWEGPRQKIPPVLKSLGILNK